MQDLTKDLAQISEKFRYFHAKRQTILNRIRILVGQPGNIVNKARLFDNSYKMDGYVFAAKVILILYTFNVEMHEILSEMKKLLVSAGSIIWMIVPATLRSLAMVFEKVGEVSVTPT